MKNFRITEWCSRFIQEQVNEGDICIDATMGNGNDTLLLCSLCGETGTVLAFDIQDLALEHTKKLLDSHHALQNYRLILDSHTNMRHYASEETVSCIVFNLGYLPGGDHALATRSETSIQALEESLVLLKKGGMISLCIYSGGDSGFEERDAVLSWLSSLDSRKYLVLKTEYYNRPNNPPIPVIILKLN
ncbi:MAG: class I SAM-dependent methyltransferase [Blautia sp.]|nr:class I SAM-dependent methyltransferase [Blautia sp.]MDY3999786.1 class I SAM-dependent methyltransferase [Blautia sp.]